MKAALLVIDMQQDYIGSKSKVHYYPDAFIQKVNERILLARQDDALVIYIKNCGRRQKQEYISDFAEGLMVVSDHVFLKYKTSAFMNPDLLALLKDAGVTKLEVIGIDGNCCVASTALDAAKLGFPVTVPIDYIGIHSNVRFPKTIEKLVKGNVTILD